MNVVSDRLAAWGAADATLSELGIDDESPVDVYRAIDRANVFLSFQKLGHLLGFCLPQKGGIVVTTQRQASIRRYTAAHELGHCVMHRGLLLDGEQEILGSSSLERERQAQMFAAYFLVPPPLAHRLANKHGIGDGAVSAAQVYEAARDAGVSFEALARHFISLDIIHTDELEGLLRSRPHAKEDAAFGFRRPAGHADIWPVFADEQGASVDVVAGDEIVLSLPENRTTGYRWLTETEDRQRRAQLGAPAPELIVQSLPILSDPPERTEVPSISENQLRQRLNLSVGETHEAQVTDDGGTLPILAESFRTDTWARPHQRAAMRRDMIRGEVARPDSVGSAGEHLVVLRADEEGQYVRTFYYSSPFQANEEPVTEWVLSVSARPGELEVRKRQLLDTDLDEVRPDDPPDDQEFGSIR